MFERLKRLLSRKPKVTVKEVGRIVAETPAAKENLARKIESLKNNPIAERNLKRQRDTMGYAVKGKFKPRSGFEKRQWDLKKKPQEED